MQKLAHRQPELPPGEKPAVDKQADRIRWHLEAYQKQLAMCTPAMLQYELVWLEERIADLELCLSQEDMLSTAGGRAQVESWLEETQQCKVAVERIMTLHGVAPARHSHAVAVGEHAWEVREESIKRLWGWA